MRLRMRNWRGGGEGGLGREVGIQGEGGGQNET